MRRVRRVRFLYRWAAHATADCAGTPMRSCTSPRTITCTAMHSPHGAPMRHMKISQCASRYAFQYGARPLDICISPCAVADTRRARTRRERCVRAPPWGTTSPWPSPPRCALPALDAHWTHAYPHAPRRYAEWRDGGPWVHDLANILASRAASGAGLRTPHLTASARWRLVDSVSMTFAARVRTLAADASIIRDALRCAPIFWEGIFRKAAEVGTVLSYGGRIGICFCRMPAALGNSYGVCRAGGRCPGTTKCLAS